MMKCSVLFLCLSIFFLSALQAQPLAGDYTIGGNSPDYSNFQAAVADLNTRGVDAAGVEFSVRDGIYEEAVLIKARGTSEGPIRFISESEDANAVQIKFGGSADVLRIQESSFIEFEHIKISHTGLGSSSAIEISVNSDDITIKNCIIEGQAIKSTEYAGATIYAISNTSENDCERLTIENNIVRNGTYGICIIMSQQKPEGLLVSENKIENFYGAGVLLTKLSKVVVDYNTIHTNQTGNSSAKGIELDECTGRSQITGNYIYTTEEGRLGIGLNFGSSSSTSGNEIIVANNSVQVQNKNSLCYGISQSNNSNWYLFHSNTVFVSGGTSSGNTCYNTFNAAHDTWLINNIFVNGSEASGASANKTVYIANATALAGAKNNCYYTLQSGAPFRGTFGTAYTTFNAFVAATGEINGINLNPEMLFVDGKGWKASNMALAGVGVDTSLFDEDIDGKNRLVPTSIGAHELQVVTSVIPVKQKEDIQVFYSNGYLTISSEQTSIKLFIYDLSGKKIYSTAIHKAKHEKALLPFVPDNKGIYLVNMVTSTGCNSWKVPVFDF